MTWNIALTSKIGKLRSMSSFIKLPSEPFTTRSPVFSVAFAPDEVTLAVGSGTTYQSGEIRLWDLNVAEERATLTGHKGYVMSVAFSPDGTRLAAVVNVNNAGSVSISGTATEGQTLTATVSDTDGVPANVVHPPELT